MAWVPGSRSKFGNWTSVPSHYIAEISLNVTLNHNQLNSTLAKWSKILIFKMDVFTNVLRKIFVKGSMHLIYEHNLILFHNPLFQAVDARFN